MTKTTRADNVIAAEFGKRANERKERSRNIFRKMVGGAAVAAAVVGGHNILSGPSATERALQNGEIHNGEYKIPAGSEVFQTPYLKRHDGASGQFVDADTTTIPEGTSINLKKYEVVTNENGDKFVTVVVPQKGGPGPVDIPHDLHALSEVAGFVPYDPALDPRSQVEPLAGQATLPDGSFKETINFDQ